MATGLENVSFILIPKKGNAEECANCHTIALISDTNKIMLKIIQARLQQYVNHKLPDFQAAFRKAEEPEIKLSTPTESLKKQEGSRKTSASALLATPEPLAVWITTNCGKFLRRCLLRNLYAGQETTVRTGHGTTHWFQIGKGVCKSCILSPCLFNLYAEYIM